MKRNRKQPMCPSLLPRYRIILVDTNRKADIEYKEDGNQLRKSRATIFEFDDEQSRRQTRVSKPLHDELNRRHGMGARSLQDVKVLMILSSLNTPVPAGVSQNSPRDVGFPKLPIIHSREQIPMEYWPISHAASKAPVAAPPIPVAAPPATDSIPTARSITATSARRSERDSEDSPHPRRLSERRGTISAAPPLLRCCLPKKKAGHGAASGGKRNAISAESSGPYTGEYKKVVHEKAESVAKEIAKALRKSTVFKDLKESSIDDVVDAMFEMPCEAGQVVINQGETGDYFYVVHDGVYEVYLKQSGDEPVHMYTTGGSFGELALMYDAPRAATVKCKVPGSLWALERNSFRNIVVMANQDDMDTNTSFLKSVRLLSVLTDEQREALSTLLEEIDFEPGELIIKQGDVADSLFVIRLGEASAWQSFTGRGYSEGLGNEVGRMKAGSVIGESALKGKKEYRAASVKAETKVTILRLGREEFLEMVGDLSELAKANFNEKVLNSIEMFQLLEQQEQAVLLESLEETKFEKGELVIKQGDEGDAMYIILEGTVMVTQETEDGKIVTIAPEVGAGSYFGEMALINDAPRMASITATSPLLTMKLGRETFNEVLGPIEEVLSREVARRQKEVERSKREPIRFEDLTIENILGVGTFGRVKLAVHQKTFMPYGLKCMRKAQIIGLKQVEHILNERKIMAILDHPFLLGIEAWYQDASELYMLVELALGGELFSLLRDQGTFDEHSARFYAACVASGLGYLHDRKIAYRDLKPENLLFDPEGYVKIIDYGFAKIVTNRTFTLCGTNEYLAPEIIQHKGHNGAVDWWAFGILIFEMMTGSPPWVADDPMDIFKKVVSSKHSLPFFFPKRCKMIIDELLVKNPLKRLGSFRGGSLDVRNHAWFDEIDFGDLQDKAIPAPYLPIIESPTDTSNFDSHEEEPGEMWAHFLTPQTDRLFDGFGGRLPSDR